MGDDRYLYVNEELEFLTGDDARRAIQQDSDARFIDPLKGIVRVPEERWRRAQAYERRTWLVANVDAHDDRNEQHSEKFGAYQALTGLSFDSAIELGCGPFTNLRMLAQRCTIRRCTLLDPLILDYLRHPHCRYDRRALQIEETAMSRALAGTRAGRALRRLLRIAVPSLVTKFIPIDDLLAMPIETMPTETRYDLVVMINVLEHCYDAVTILNNVLKILEPGGIFVFHDKVFDLGELEKDVTTHFDAGHPLRVAREIIDSFLEKHFRPLHRCEDIVSDVFDEFDLSRRGIYFIGRRL